MEGMDKIDVLQRDQERWSGITTAMNDELMALAGELEAVKGLLQATSARVARERRRSAALQEELTRVSNEHKHVDAEWLEEARVGTGAHVVHNPMELTTLAGARHAYAVAVLHGNKLKDKLAATEGLVGSYGETIERQAESLAQWQHAYAEQQVSLDIAEQALQEVLALVAEASPRESHPPDNPLPKTKPAVLYQKMPAMDALHDAAMLHQHQQLPPRPEQTQNSPKQERSHIRHLEERIDALQGELWHMTHGATDAASVDQQDDALKQQLHRIKMENAELQRVIDFLQRRDPHADPHTGFRDEAADNNEFDSLRRKHQKQYFMLLSSDKEKDTPTVM